MTCFFVSDLHGHSDRYQKLLKAIITERPRVLFLGGDLLPTATRWAAEKTTSRTNFVADFLTPAFHEARVNLGEAYPSIFLILGNDDPNCELPEFLKAESEGLWRYIHGTHASLADVEIYGYGCVPPTPFLLKDWERYDVSRYVSPGCVSPEEGHRTAPVHENEIKWGTIARDLDKLVGEENLERAVFLMHAPPYDTPLDYAALDGKMFDHVPVDVHVGSIAVRRFIEERQPWLTLHGHVHEAARITSEWKIQIGRTVCINAAHDGPELALVRFDFDRPADATRELL